MVNLMLTYSVNNTPGDQQNFRTGLAMQNGAHVLVIYIGAENDSDVMSNTTLIFKNINIQGSQFAVGVIGPKRMNYQKVIDMINSLANRIDIMYSDSDNEIKALPNHQND